MQHLVWGCTSALEFGAGQVEQGRDGVTQDWIPSAKQDKEKKYF